MRIVPGVLLLAGLAVSGHSGMSGTGTTPARSLLPERVLAEAQARTDARWYPTLVIAYVHGDKSEVRSILTNIGGSVDDLGFAALSDAPLRSYRTAAVDQSILNSYVGVFNAPDSGLIKIYLQDGQLYAQAKGEDGIPLFAKSSDEFFTRIDGFHLIFRSNGEGGVGSVVLRQKSADRVALKLEGQDAAAALLKF